MKEKNYIIRQIDPESTVGLAISDAIETAKRENKKVVVCLRNTACVVTKNTKLSDGIERYRKNVERFVRSRN
ncbi:MAG: hypothetical protein J5601_00960 [Elusimicrobiaceae bacterium]|nr:hypothetical protein [Elusimicrobiaceae bacterium]